MLCFHELVQSARESRRPDKAEDLIIACHSVVAIAALKKVKAIKSKLAINFTTTTAQQRF